MALGLNTLRSFVDWFISSAPRPFKIALFFILILSVGSVLNDFLTNDHACLQDSNENYFLIEELVSDRALGLYEDAFITQLDITETNFTDDGITENTANTIIDKLTSFSLGGRFFGAVTNFFSALIGVNNHGEDFNFYGRLSRPEDFLCDDLYHELEGTPNADGDGELRDDLGLFDQCGIQDIPSRELWLSTAYGNTTGEVTQLIGVSCIGKDKEVTFIGFPLLDWRFWFFGFVLGIVFVLATRWRRWIDMH